MDTVQQRDAVQATAMAAWLLFKGGRRALALDDESATVVVYGHGAVSAAFAELAHRHGVKVVAMSGKEAGTYNPEGLSMQELVEHVQRTGAVKDFWAGRDIADDELRSLACGVLALGEGVTFTPEAALQARAKAVLPLAGEPLAPETEDVLLSRGIAVIR